MVGQRVYQTVCVGLRTGSGDRRLVWLLRSRQNQAFNLGVELGLDAVERAEAVPSAFDGYKVLTQRRRDGSVPSHPTVLQRPGLRAGLDAVSKWRATAAKHDSNVEYWQGRVESAPDSDHEDALEHARRKLSAAGQRRREHVDRGSGRLFRSRKQFEREPSNGAALVFHDRALLRSGAVVLPGGALLGLADPGWQPEGGWELTGAVQIVDTTPRVTSATRPEHREYEAHFQLRREQALAPLPKSKGGIVGIDAGVAIPVMASDGREFHLPDEDEIAAEIKELQQARSRCTYGSRMWRRRTRRLRRLEAKRANRRTGASRRIAKAIATTDGITAVGAEAANAKNLISSAKGTAAHPGRNVAQKRGLNRSLSRSRYGGIRKDTERACAMAGTHYIPVPPAGTSQICHDCGATGTRDTQADFRCHECGWEGNADLNAANTVRNRAWSQIEVARRPVQSPSDGRPGGKPGQRASAPKTVPNKYQTAA